MTHSTTSTVIAIVLCFVTGCEPGQEFIKCAQACEVSGLKMVECVVNTNKDSPLQNASCKCGEPLTQVK